MIRGYTGTVLVVYGDNVIRTDRIPALLERHVTEEAAATILTYVPDDIWTPASDGCVRYGILETEESGRVVSFREKPPANPYRAVASAAAFAIQSSVIQDRSGDAEDFSRDLFERGGLKLWSEPIGDAGFRRDIGFRDEYRALNLDVLRGAVAAPIAGREVGLGVFAKDGTHPGCVVQGRVAVGSGCSIHPSAKLEDCVLGDEVYIGPGVRVTRSVIQNRARLEAGAFVVEAVVGDEAIVRASAGLGAGSVIGPCSVAGSEAADETDAAGFNRAQRDRQQGELQGLLDTKPWTLGQKLSFLWDQQVGVFLPALSGQVRRHQFMSPSGSAFLLAQVNQRRTQRLAGGPVCALCVEHRNPAQQFYRVSSGERAWNCLGNPFALGSLHFTVASERERPQRFTGESLVGLLEDMWYFAAQLPSFVGFYNGAESPNKEGSAGCSIERHLHIQVLQPFRLLPLQWAAQAARRRLGAHSITPILEDYPLAAFRVAGPRELVVSHAAQLLSRWREIADRDATENILTATEEGGVVFYIVPRRGTQSAWGLSGRPGGLEAFGDIVLSAEDEIKAVAEQRIGYQHLYRGLRSVRPLDADRLAA